MINKEIIYRNGGIERDFINKQIPQYSHMQVNVNCLIPAALLQGLPNYAVMLAMEFKADDAEDYEQRPSLVMFTGKALTIDGIDYIKFMALLPINYTDKVGRLKLTPYIQTTAEIEVEVDGTLVPRTITAIQQTFTEGYLIVVKASRDTGDTSVEDPEQITALLALINSKRIFYVNEYREAAYGALLWHIWNDYNPALTIYKGAIIMAKYDKFQDTPEGPYKKKTNVYFNCQVTTGETDENYILMLDVETREMTKYYNIERTETEGAYNYSYQEEKVTYNKAAIDALIQDLWDAKVDKTTKINGYTLDQDVTLDNTDVGLGNVKNYDVESTPTASGNELYITSKGVYDALQLIYSALNGYATTSDLSAINTRLESVEAIIGSDDGDADNVINTLKEVIVVLNGLGEGASLLDLINAKANQTDLTALSGVVNAMGLKVDVLYDANANAYMEIKAQSGTIDILTTDWDDNDDDYASDYPKKWTLTNGYLVGASNVIVVFSVDSDTSLLSTSVAIDDVNGSITIYASETPSDTISIEKVAVFNNVNAYINYSNTIVQQVNANTSAIGDINNVKLPQYVKKEIIRDNYRTFVRNVNYEESGSQYVDASLQAVEIEDASNFTNCGVSATLTGAMLSTTKVESGVATTHTLKLDTDGNLTLDGNAVGGGGGHKVIKCFNPAIEPYVLNGHVITDVWCITATAIGYGVATDTATGNTPTSFDAGDIVLGYSQVEHGTFGDPDFYADNILNQILVVNSTLPNGDVLLQFQQLAQYSESRMLTTATTPTDTAGVLTLSASDVNEGGGKVGDYISYISSGSISTLYKITAVNYVNDAFVYTIEKVGDIGGGKQLYQHNIFMQNNNDKKLTCQVTIINDSNVAFNYSTLAQWLNDKGFAYANSTHKWYNAKGHFSSGTIMGIDFVENQNAIFALQLSADFSSQTEGSISTSALTTTDTVIPL